MKVLRHIASIGGVNVWLQPGAESPEVLNYLDRHGRDFGVVTYDDCIMTSLERVYKNAT